MSLERTIKILDLCDTGESGCRVLPCLADQALARGLMRHAYLVSVDGDAQFRTTNRGREKRDALIKSSKPFKR